MVTSSSFALVQSVCRLSPGSSHLGEKHFLGWSVPVPPVVTAALKRAQRPTIDLPGVRVGQQVLKERLGLHFRAFLQPALGLRPDRRQRILPRPPRVRLAQFCGPLPARR